MDIGSNSSYPSNALSNFSANRFVVDGVECYSMEGFLQSLKFKSPQMQEEVCKLIGKKAKFKGKGKKWFREQVLWWKGNPMKRDSKEYQHLLDVAYQSMFNQSEGFRRALRLSGSGNLTHSMGKNKISETVLTTSEFVGRLMKLRRGEVLTDDFKIKVKQIGMFEEMRLSGVNFHIEDE